MMVVWSDPIQRLIELHVDRIELRVGFEEVGSEELELHVEKILKKNINRVRLGTRRGGLNGYPLKRRGGAVDGFFWGGYLNGSGRGGAGRNPTHTAPLPSLFADFKLTNFCFCFVWNLVSSDLMYILFSCANLLPNVSL
jgi:hypothetical protein